MTNIHDDYCMIKVKKKKKILKINKKSKIEISIEIIKRKKNENNEKIFLNNENNYTFIKQRIIKQK